MNKETDRTDFTADREPDRALKDDIRLLGRILGDTVRDQQGRRFSTWSNSFARPRCASIATATRKRVPNSNPFCAR